MRQQVLCHRGNKSERTFGRRSFVGPPLPPAPRVQRRVASRRVGAAHVRARFCTDDVTEIWLSFSLVGYAGVALSWWRSAVKREEDPLGPFLFSIYTCDIYSGAPRYAGRAPRRVLLCIKSVAIRGPVCCMERESRRYIYRGARERGNGVA